MWGKELISSGGHLRKKGGFIRRGGFFDAFLTGDPRTERKIPARGEGMPIWTKRGCKGKKWRSPPGTRGGNRSEECRCPIGRRAQGQRKKTALRSKGNGEEGPARRHKNGHNIIERATAGPVPRPAWTEWSAGDCASAKAIHLPSPAERRKGQLGEGGRVVCRKSGRGRGM